MATQQELMTALSRYLDEDTLYEVYNTLNSAPDMAGAQGKPALEKLMSDLSALGVPQELLGQAVQVAQQSTSGSGEQASRDASALAMGGTLDDPSWTAGANDGGSIQSIIKNNGLQAALPYMSPEEQASAQQAMGGVVGDQGWQLEPWMIDDARQSLGMPAYDARTEEQKLADSRNGQFGNDMAWLDEMFQQDPTAALKQAQAMGTTADPEVAKQQQALVDDVRSRGLTADQKSRDAQQGVVDELGNIYAQGGQTARDRLLRQKARSESENWLKGQREADMQDLAERGMSGGGAELLTMLGDRQDAASRLSMADLQASADAEQRALDALMGKGAMAGQMEGAANQYTQGNDALAGNLLGGMRSAADAYTQGNADIISKVAQTNKDFLRDAYQQTMDRRQQWDRDVMAQQADMSKFLADLDARENAAGWGFGYTTAGQDTGAMNDARPGFNGSTQGAFTGQTPMVRGAGNQQVAYTGAPQAHAGQAFSGAANFVGNLFSGLYGGGGGKMNQTELQNKEIAK